jgi:hypothetical protein
MEPMQIICPECHDRMDYKARRCEACAATTAASTSLTARTRADQTSIAEWRRDAIADERRAKFAERNGWLYRPVPIPFSEVFIALVVATCGFLLWCLAAML